MEEWSSLYDLEAELHQSAVFLLQHKKERSKISIIT